MRINVIIIMTSKILVCPHKFTPHVKYIILTWGILNIDD